MWKLNTGREYREVLRKPLLSLTERSLVCSLGKKLKQPLWMSRSYAAAGSQLSMANITQSTLKAVHLCPPGLQLFLSDQH